MYRQVARAWARTQTSRACRPYKPSTQQRVTYATVPPGQACNFHLHFKFAFSSLRQYREKWTHESLVLTFIKPRDFWYRTPYGSSTGCVRARPLNIFVKFARGHPLRGRWIQVWFINVAIFNQYHGTIVATEQYILGNHMRCIEPRHFRCNWVIFRRHFGDLLTAVTFYAQLTRALLAIAKFLVKWVNSQTNHVAVSCSDSSKPATKRFLFRGTAMVHPVAL